MNKNESYIGVVETAEILGVSIRTIQRQVASGVIPGTKLGQGSKAPYLLDRQVVLSLATERGNK